MVYANYSQGYKAGGYNSRGTIPEYVVPYEPERVTAYEVGLKSGLVVRLLRYNVAVFVHQSSNQQSPVTNMGAVRHKDRKSTRLNSSNECAPPLHTSACKK